MSMNTMGDVGIGSTRDEVEQCYGRPYATNEYCDGTVEYEYIERFKAGDRNIEYRRYIFVFKDGKLVSKRYDQGSPPGYDFNYDTFNMQTTENTSVNESGQ